MWTFVIGRPIGLILLYYQVPPPPHLDSESAQVVRGIALKEVAFNFRDNPRSHLLSASTIGAVYFGLAGLVAVSLSIIPAKNLCYCRQYVVNLPHLSLNAFRQRLVKLIPKSKEIAYPEVP